MAAPSLPDAESLRMKAISAATALMIASSPLQAMTAETEIVRDLSPAEMLVQKTTDSQVSRCEQRPYWPGGKKQTSGLAVTDS